MKKLFIFAALLLAACSPTPEGSMEVQCQDELDNDKDGKYDCEDEGCIKSATCIKLLEEFKKAEKEAKKVTKKVEKNIADGPILNMENLLVQKGISLKDVNFTEAEKYCEKLDITGIKNWRLPTSLETVKILQKGVLPKNSFVMWTSTKKGNKRAYVVGITSLAVHDLAVSDKGQCRARCVKETTSTK